MELFRSLSETPAIVPRLRLLVLDTSVDMLLIESDPFAPVSPIALLEACDGP